MMASGSYIAYYKMVDCSRPIRWPYLLCCTKWYRSLMTQFGWYSTDYKVHGKWGGKVCGRCWTLVGRVFHLPVDAGHTHFGRRFKASANQRPWHTCKTLPLVLCWQHASDVRWRKYKLTAAAAYRYKFCLFFTENTGNFPLKSCQTLQRMWWR